MSFKEEVYAEVPRELWVPCHRVVAKDGSLAVNFAFDGYEEQAARLIAEGVEVVEGKVAREFMI